VIEVLRLCGADPHAQNGRGGSALKLTRSIANFNVRQYFNDLTVRFLQSGEFQAQSVDKSDHRWNTHSMTTAEDV
jgi:hypothetical protein